MADHDKDIDALLRFLDEGGWDWHHAALTALVAERNALKQRVAELEPDFRVAAQLLREERNALRERVAELEAASKPADRDLRERLVCAIWPELLRIYEKTDTTGANWDLVRINARTHALLEADAMIAAMRKGESDGK